MKLRGLYRIVSLLLSIVMLFQIAPFAFSRELNEVNSVQHITDDFSSHWAANDIRFLMGRGIVLGYENGEIRPNNLITRAEVVAVVNRAFEFFEESEDNFPDIDNDVWYAAHFRIAKKAGYINGDNNGNAHPERRITRSEISVLLANMLKLTASNTKTGFIDNDEIPDWALESIIALEEREYVLGYPDKTYRALNDLTRAEAFAMIARILRMVEDIGADPETPLSPTPVPSRPSNTGTVPTLEILVEGDLRVNRKLTISGGASTRSAADYERLIVDGVVSMQIKPLDEDISEFVICIDDETALADYNELIIKQAGEYEITLTVDRPNNPVTITKTITIAKDQPPVADFALEDEYYRDSTRKARITIEDKSSSPDNDKIGKWQWTVIHDKDNEGVFPDEEAVQFECTENELFAYIAEEVGFYQVQLTVTETYENTIPRFLFDDDFLYATSAKKVFEVKNQAPSVSGHVEKVKQLDLVATFGELTNYKFHTIGDAYIRNDDVVELTGLGSHEAGGYWMQSPVDTTGVSVLEFDFYMGDGYADNTHGNGADGITVSFAPALPKTLSSGEFMGFYGEGAFGVEFDSFTDTEKEWLDGQGDHIAIIQDSVGNHLKTISVGELDNKTWHSVKIQYQSDSVEVYFNGNLVLEYTGVYQFDTAYIGISASTGLYVNNHWIRDVRYSSDISEERKEAFKDALTQVKEELEDRGAHVRLSGIDTLIYHAQDTFDWDIYEHTNYRFRYISPQPPDRPHSIVWDGNDIQMLGFNVEAYKDFLFLPDSYSGEKTFTFNLIRDRTNWHSIEGGGFLFNTVIENNTIEGYCILTTQTGLKLVRINRVNLTNFRNGSYNMVQNAGQLLTTVNIGDPYARHSFKIVVSPTHISVWHNGNLVIDNYRLPIESRSYGFGPITSHISHSCSQLSFYTFSNIRMESQQSFTLAEALDQYEWSDTGVRALVHISDAEVDDLSGVRAVGEAAETINKKAIDYIAVGNDDNSDQFAALVNNVIKGAALDGGNMESFKNELVELLWTRIKAEMDEESGLFSTKDMADYIYTYSDPENDPFGEEKFLYLYDSSMFDNRSYFGGHAYQRFDIGMTWQDAKKYCEDLGGYLATITSQAEQDFIETLIDAPAAKTYYWLGGTDEEVEGEWKWITGEEWDYTNWRDGEPNNAGKEDYLHIWAITESVFHGATKYKWNDFNNYGSVMGIAVSGFICEWDANTPVYGSKKTSFDKTGIYDIYLKVCDAPSIIAPLADAYRLWSSETNLDKITVHHRPVALLDVSLSANPNNLRGASLKLDEHGFDPDHADLPNLGIVASEWKWKNLNDLDWTTGRPPEILPYEGEYLIYYRVKDMEGSWSFPACVYLSTIGMTPFIDTEPPVISLSIEKLVWNENELVMFEASATDNDEVEVFEVYVGGNLHSTAYGRQTFVARNLGQVTIEVVARDFSGNEARESLVITVVGIDRIPPEITLHQPNPGETFYVKTDIIISITDNVAVSSWKVERKLPGAAEFVLVLQGTQAVHNEVIDTIDPANMALGLYEYLITATDTSGNTTRSTLFVTISIDDKDTTPPIVEIITPSHGDVLSGIVGITGTAKDETALASYELKLIAPNSVETILANGQNAVDAGLLATWDTTSGDDGIYQLELNAIDAAGNRSMVRITVYVKNTEDDNEPPSLAFVSPKHGDVVDGKVSVKVNITDNRDIAAYDLAIKAADDDDFEVVATGSGMVNGDEIYVWDTADLEHGTYAIRLSARDSAGNRSSLTIYVIIGSEDGTAPFVDFVTPKHGDTVRGNVSIRATITDNRSIASYELGIKPVADNDFEVVATGSGAVNNGEIFVWNTATLQDGTYALRLSAENTAGKRSSLTIYIEVSNNTTRKVELIVNNGQSYANINSNVPVQVIADEQYVLSSLVIKVNGNAIAVDEDGKSSFVPDTAGIYTISASILDQSGNETVLESELRAIDPGNNAYPNVEIRTPLEGAVVTAPTDIIGTVTENGLVRYVLEYAPVGSSQFTLLTEGIRPVANGKLGVFDPTLLENGFYNIRLTGYGANFHAIDEVTVSVEGEMKVGNFSIAFIDMVFPMHGFPLSVSRSYDSRNRGQSGDFGFGWQLALSGAKLSLSCALGHHWGQRAIPGPLGMTNYVWAEEKVHEVSIDWGNGKTEKFAMRLSPTQSVMLPMQYDISASYVAIGNATSKLEAQGSSNNLFYNGGSLFEFGGSFNLYSPGRYKVTAEDGTVYIFSADGQVESITDTLGNIITINRNGVHHSDGKSLAFQRDSGNRITKITGPTGKEVQYRYNAAGDLVEVIDVTGESTSFVYDRNHFLTDIIDPRGVRAARNEYDDAGRLIAVIDANGNRMEFNNDVAGRRQVVTDRLGNSTLFVYDERGNILSQTDALGNTTNSEYDANGNLSSQKDALGNITKFEYTPDGKLLSKMDALGNKVSNAYNSRGYVTSVSHMDVMQVMIDYDAQGNPTAVEGVDGSKTDYAYDARGQLTGVTDQIGQFIRVSYNSSGHATSATRGDGSTASFTYDEDGNCTSKTETRMGASGIETLTESYVHDSAGHVIRTIRADGSTVASEYNSIGKISAAVDAKGRRTTYAYDMFGNLERISYNDGTFETFVYDAEGRNISVTSRTGRTATMIYDAVGNLLAKTYANGAVETYDYDSKYRLKEYTSISGGVTRYEYDAADRNTAVIDALGNRTEYIYNSKSQMTSMKDARGNTFRYEYDANGNRTRVIMPDDSSITTVCNVRNRIISQTDQNGFTKLYSYDGADRLSSVTDAEGSEWRYSYNSVGNLISVTDAMGNVSRYEYDKVGRMIKTTNAAGKVSTATYDESGCLLTSTDFAGVSTSFTYDSNDRLIRREAGTIWVSYTYTQDGKLLTASDSSGVTRFTYDDMDGLIKVEYPGGEYISYTYDNALRLTGLQTTHGNVTYSYDVLDRLTSAEDSSGKTTYQYNAVGNRSMVTYPNGISMIYEYDSLNRLVRQDVKNSESGIITSYAYTLGKFGERLKAEEPNRTVVYTYDKLYRLTGESITSGGTTTDMSYTYDAVSNRLSKTVDGVVISYAYNELNQLVSETGITYIYNAAGNLIRKTETGKVTEFEYDAWNQLTKATITEAEGTGTESYQYDALGNRVAKTTNGITTRYLVDTNTAYAQVIAEFEGTGSLKAFYSRNGMELISRLDRVGKTHYYVYDGHGDTRMLIDKDGAITDTYVFDAWGNLLSRTGDTENPFLYCGEQFDALTGLYYLRVRYMNPATGTFISMDTYRGSIFDPVSLHKYLYAHANPIMFIDPSGHMALPLLLGGAALHGHQRASIDPGVIALGALVGIAILSILFNHFWRSISALGGDSAPSIPDGGINDLVSGVNNAIEVFWAIITTWLSREISTYPDTYPDTWPDTWPDSGAGTGIMSIAGLPDVWTEILKRAKKLLGPVYIKAYVDSRYDSIMPDPDSQTPITIDMAVIHIMSIPSFTNDSGVLAMDITGATALVAALGGISGDHSYIRAANGYLPHFHPAFKPNAHIWFLP